MPRHGQNPDPTTAIRIRLRTVEQAASDVVLAVESLRATLRQAVAAVDDLPRGPLSVPDSPPPPRQTNPPITPGAPRILRLKEVARLCGLGRSTIWKLASEGKFPERRQITERTVGWFAEEVEHWIKGRALGR